MSNDDQWRGGAASQEATRRTAPSDSSDRERRAGRLVVLVGRAARGDEDAFAQLYDETSSRVYGLVLRVIRSPEMAEEVTQEVYVEIWRQASRYSPVKGGVLAWITTIAHRRAVDRVRSESADTARDLKYAQRNAEPDRDSVWDSIDQQLDAERVRLGLEQLTPIQRQALTLAYFGGHTQVEIAKLLDVPLGTAKTRIRDALIGLRDALGVEA